MKSTTIILLCGCNVGRLHTFQGGYDRAAAGIIKQEEWQNGGEAGSAGVWASIRDSYTGDPGQAAVVVGANQMGRSRNNKGGVGWSSPHHLNSHTIHYAHPQV